MAAKEAGGGGWMVWESGVSRGKLLYDGQTAKSYCIAQGTIFSVL